MSAAHPVLLRSNASGDYVTALLHERIDETYARRTDERWLAYLAAAEGRADALGRSFSAPGNAHWRWYAKVHESAHLLSCPTLAVDCEDEPQGLMLLKTDGHFARLPGQGGKPIVYVSYLATAPWNLRKISENPRFSGVGTVLTKAAIQTSLELEFKGRVGLHSLPEAETFYECHGFECLGPDATKENLKYYELSPEAAAAFLK